VSEPAAERPIASRLCVLLVGAGLVMLCAPAGATSRLMAEEGIRADFIGRTIDGHFRSGMTWSATFFGNGRMDQYYRYHPLQTRRQKIEGRWFFQAGVFCSFPDPPHLIAFIESCWTVVKASANCYEFYRVPVFAGKPGDRDSHELAWYGRAWRQGEPATCDLKPSV
jgi:hypothetical protein